MSRSHESFGKIRLMVAVIGVIAVLPCKDLAALQAGPPPARSTHRSSGSSNPDHARRIVVNLGVGQEVVARLSSGETVRGRIREIAEDQFVVDLDWSATPAYIAYGDVRQLGPIVLQPSRRSHVKQGVIGVAIAVGAGIASYTIQGCSHHSAC